MKRVHGRDAHQTPRGLDSMQKSVPSPPLICQRVTVNVTGTPVLLEPDVAVTVTVDVPAGVPVAGAGGLPPEFVAGGGEESLPLQLNIPTSVNVAKKLTATLRNRRCDP
jgi:hypothetical protein